MMIQPPLSKAPFSVEREFSVLSYLAQLIFAGFAPMVAEFALLFAGGLAMQVFRIHVNLDSQSVAEELVAQVCSYIVLLLIAVVGGVWIWTVAPSSVIEGCRVWIVPVSAEIAAVLAVVCFQGLHEASRLFSKSIRREARVPRFASL